MEFISKTAILFLIFKRPDVTAQVFKAIRQVRPSRLYVAGDGAGNNQPGETEKVLRARQIVLDGIDWPCEVKTLFRDKNLGCRAAVFSAIDWFFEHEEEGIILEDDILPDPSFFGFCLKMLEAHREDTQVMHISGFNCVSGAGPPGQDYLFSRFGTIWGWATWRRAWKTYRVDLVGWRRYKRKVFENFPRSIWKERARLYDRLACNEIDTWDYQWTFWRLVHDGISIVPMNNLVRNIGFGTGATHSSKEPKWAGVNVQPMDLENLRVNRDICVDAEYDRKFLNIVHSIPSRRHFPCHLKQVGGIGMNLLQRLRQFFVGSLERELRDLAKETAYYSDAPAQISLMMQYRSLFGLQPDSPVRLDQVGFRKYSQNEEDGLLLFLFALLGTTDKRCVEICAGNGRECNTSNLILNHRWKGLLFDGSKKNVEAARAFFAGHPDSCIWPPTVVHAWITRENINDLIRENGFEGEVDLLSLDIDGNDYWIFKALDVILPRVVVLEINHLWGARAAMTVPYAVDFVAEFTEWGSDYAGASLPAFMKLCGEKGYRLVGTNVFATNAFFVRNDLPHPWLPEVRAEDCFSHPRAKFGMERRYPAIENKPWQEV